MNLSDCNIYNFKFNIPAWSFNYSNFTYFFA